MSPARLIQIFLLGGLGGALCDQVHLRLGAVRYASPALFGQAWWVAPALGAGITAFFLFARAVAERAGDRIPPPTPMMLIVGPLLFLGAFVAAPVFPGGELAAAITYAVLWALRIAPSAARNELILVSVVIAVLGTGGEVLLAATGAFSYTSPEHWLVPLWVPPLYLLFGAFVFRTAHVL